MRNTVKQLLSVVTISLLVAIVSVTVSLVAFMANAVQEHAESNDVLSIYEKTDYDYIIKNPSDEQIGGFSENSSIEKTVPYYQLVYTFEIANADIELTLKSIDYVQDLDYTEFAQARLVKKRDVSENKEIYLDYSLSSRCGLNIGDTIGSGTMQFVVAGFYQNYDERLAFVPNLKEVVQSPLSYAGVYVDVKNENAFLTSVVKNYKPLATLKDKDSFSDDAAYQSYLNNFNSRDYSAYVVDKSNGLTEAKESFNNKIAEAKSLYVIAGVVAGAVALLGLVSLSVFSVGKIKYEVVDGARGKVLFRYAFGAFVALIGVISTWMIGVCSIISSQLHYIGLANVFLLGWASLIIPIGCVLAGMMINVFVIQGYREKRR